MHRGLLVWCPFAAAAQIYNMLDFQAKDQARAARAGG